MPTAVTTVSSRYLTFRAGAQLYALPTTAVTEVVRLAAVARVPLGPRALLGIANLRGAVVPVVGLQELLGPEKTPDSAKMVALALDHAPPTALVVDEIATLEDVATDQIETGSQAFDAHDREKLMGAFKIERTQQVAKILDIDTLLKSAFEQVRGAQRVDRKDRALTHRVPRPQQSDSSENLVTFEVAEQEFALNLAVVEEILPAPTIIATLSKADDVIVGFTAVRNELIPLLSLRALLGFRARAQPTGREKVVVLKVSGAAVGLVVDAARSVVLAQADAMESVPPVLAARTGGEARIKTIYRGDAGRRLISILSPDLLFREDVMQRLGTLQPADHKNVALPQTMTRSELIFLVFRLGEDEFGLPIDSVVEVAQVPTHITRIPKTPKFLDGVVNLRGDVLPVIDQRRRFDMPKLIHAEGQRLVVLKTDGHRAGIIVDSVSEVLHVPADTVSPPPQLTATITRLVHGVVNLERSNRLVLLLDPTELLSREEQGQLSAFRTQSKKVRV